MGLFSKIKKWKPGKTLAAVVKSIAPAAAPLVDAIDKGVSAAGRVIKGQQTAEDASKQLALDREAEQPRAPGGFPWKTAGVVGALVLVGAFALK